MTTYLRRSAALAAVAALFLALPGCIFSPDPGDDVGGTPKPLDYPWPSTEIQLMENFKTAYGGRDIFPYIGSMGENPVYPVLYNDADSEDAYKFRFSQQDMEDPELGLTTDILTYDEEVAIATRMFSGASSTQEGADGAAITQSCGPQPLRLVKPRCNPGMAYRRRLAGYQIQSIRMAG